MPDIVTRAQWGANYKTTKELPRGYYTVGIAEKDEFFVHYHGGVPSASVGVWVPRNVEAIHHANGWSGVGYSYVVDQAGTIYEGRGWDGVAVACPDHNRRGIHVYVAIGGTQEATDAAKRSVVALRDEHRRLRALGSHSRPAEYVHGDKYPTACAGPTLTPWVHAGMPITEEDPLMGLTINLTDDQRDAIYGNHDTSPKTWDAEKALGYIAGQAALIRKAAVASAKDAAIARALGEAEAEKGTKLSDDERGRVSTETAEKVAGELGEGFEVTGDVRLAPKAAQ